MVAIDNAVEVLKTMPNVEVYERIGSLVYYQLNQFYIPLSEAKALFQGTLLEEFVQPSMLSTIISSFDNECRRILNPLYDSKLKSFSQYIDKNVYYLVFFTGDVKQKNDETRFHEAAKFYIDNEDITLLNADDQWQIKTSEEISRIWQRCWMWNKGNLGVALNNALKKHGYKFFNKKDIIFLPVPLTDEFYKIRNIIKDLNGSQLSIAPVIAGNMADAEEYRKIVSEGFENEFLTAKKRLFGICVYMNYQQKEWENFTKLVQERKIETLKTTYIGQKTRYGQQLIQKLEVVDRNASDTEYQEIAEEWVYSVIIPQKNPRHHVLYDLQQVFKDALDKIQYAAKSRYFQSLKDDIEKDVLITAKIMATVSEQLVDEVLKII